MSFPFLLSAAEDVGGVCLLLILFYPQDSGTEGDKACGVLGCPPGRLYEHQFRSKGKKSDSCFLGQSAHWIPWGKKNLGSTPQGDKWEGKVIQLLNKLTHRLSSTTSRLPKCV